MWSAVITTITITLAAAFIKDHTLAFQQRVQLPNTVRNLLQLFSKHCRRYNNSIITMRTSSQRLAAVRNREAMLLASVNCNNLCLKRGSYLPNTREWDALAPLSEAQPESLTWGLLLWWGLPRSRRNGWAEGAGCCLQAAADPWHRQSILSQIKTFTTKTFTTLRH